MRIGLLGTLGALALAAGAAGTGCSTDPGSGGSSGGTTAGGMSGSAGAGATGGASAAGGASGSAGTSASGGSGGSLAGTGGVVDCASGTPCGGNVVGSWNVASSCLELSGDMDVSLTSLGCRTVPVVGSLQTTGSIVFNDDGTYVDNTTTTGSVSFPLEPSCLSVSSVSVTCDRAANIFVSVGWDNSVCTDTNGQCRCSLSTVQTGGLGAIVSYTEPSGSYTTEGDSTGNSLTATNVTYSYCASGDTLTLTPEMSSLTGTVVLQREGAGGSGGAGGSSGAAGTSGSSGASGTAGTSGEAGSGGMAGTSGAAGSAGASGASGAAGGTSVGPCDLYAAANNTCVAAHSTVRALFGAYSGNLYQVKRASDGMTKDIPVKSPGGFADSAQQDAFCMGTTCTIWRVYDQSGNDNFIEAQTPDSTVGGRQGMTAANAAAESLTVGGNNVYSLYTRPSQAYWRDGSQSGMPLGAEPQGVYMVTSGTHFNGGCCYNYGNAQTSRTYEGGPTMDSVYFGNCTIWGSGAGNGPWVMADMEDGIVSGNSTGQNPNLESLPFDYVTAMEKNNGTSEFAIKGADATSSTLNTYYQGALPPGKNPMKKEGAIVLGSGGDCCYSNNNASEGTFYEGAIVSGYPSDATDEAVHANIVSAGYGE